MATNLCVRHRGEAKSQLTTMNFGKLAGAKGPENPPKHPKSPENPENATKMSKARTAKEAEMVRRNLESWKTEN